MSETASASSSVQQISEGMRVACDRTCLSGGVNMHGAAEQMQKEAVLVDMTLHPAANQSSGWSLHVLIIQMLM